MTSLFDCTSGPLDAPIMLVGESWGSEEAVQKRPFVGGAGLELDRMLAEAGIARNSILCTNVFNAQPEDNEAWHFFHDSSTTSPRYRGLCPTNFAVSEIQRLEAQIRAVKPRLVIAAGNYAMWATADCCSISSTSTGNGATVRVPGGITSWRGSMLESATIPGLQLKVLPILHPAAIMRAWYQRAVTVHDLRTRVPRALQNMWRPLTGPKVLAPGSFAETRELLGLWKGQLDRGNGLRLSHDIETARGFITCMSFATGPYDETGTALVIPFVRPEGKIWRNFWSEREEIELVQCIVAILSHPNIQIEGQNYLYDLQYIESSWGRCPRLDFDTMLAHHLLFPGTPKGLDYLSSLYCRYHWYWKEDLKEWNNSIDWEQNLRYNAEDSLRTFECASALRTLIRDHGMSELWEWEKRKNSMALSMMQKGVRINREARARLAFELSTALGERHSWLSSIIPQTWLKPFLKTSKSNWWESVHQQKTLFYEILGLKGQTNRKTGKSTINYEALQELKSRNPELSRIFDCLIDCRSIGIYHNTFIKAELEPDGRMKCMFNTAGTSTFRWSSSSNAFGRGGNLQNIPMGEED